MLVDKLIQEGNNIQAKLNEVENEIYNSFVTRFHSPDFEKDLASYFSEENKRERKRSFNLEFWDHHEGCSDTHFNVMCYSWYNPTGKNYDSCYYKGVRLYDLQKTLCPRLLELAQTVLKEQGFNVLSIDDKSGRLGYYHKQININW